MRRLHFRVRQRYLIVDGHSIIFAWPALRRLHQRRTSLAREALVKRLRDYQDWTGIRVVVVFDGKGRVAVRLRMLSSNDWPASTQRASN
jgi:predicted RNA-binding protein with PIN domain